MKIPAGERRVVEILLLKIILKKFSDFRLVLARVRQNFYRFELLDCSLHIIRVKEYKSL